MAATTKTQKRPRGPRMSAEERREAVVDIAVDEFAKRGLHGTPTEEIANKAGISHAYLFRLFPTKTDLFIAATERCFERVIETFAKAAEGVEKGERLEAMGHAYVELLGDRTRLLSQLQGYAACEDPKVRKVVREHWAELYDFVARETGESTERLREFFAAGMLLTITAAMDLLNHDEVWAERLLPPDKS
jgi:AcrR family transcriptional regulator